MEFSEKQSTKSYEGREISEKQSTKSYEGREISEKQSTKSYEGRHPNDLLSVCYELFKLLGITRCKS
jgi:hypothetical protein